MSGFNLLQHIRKNDNSIVVWLFNIGTEKLWNKGTNALVKDKNEDVIVNHIEELNLLLTRKTDYVILRKKPDSEYINYLTQLGFEIPTILCPSVQNEEKSISELVLDDKELLKRLSEINGNHVVYFVPYGVSEFEEKIATLCGMKLIGGSNQQSVRVNNKIFSKNVAHELGFPAAEEYICTSVDEIKDAYGKLTSKYEKVIIKMPCNSSGQGMWVIENENKLNTVCLVIRRISGKIKNDKWIVEGWIEKELDLNMQVYVSDKGDVETFSVKEQLVHETLYVGSVMPSRLTNAQYEKCIYYGDKIGEYLFQQGYNGVFGIDALVDKNEQVIPIIEINGRFTLSTYISFIENKYPLKKIYAFYKRFKVKDKLNFYVLKNMLEDKKLLFDGGQGIIIYNSATVDSELAEGHVRVFCLAIADNYDDIKKIVDETIELFDGIKEI